MAENTEGRAKVILRYVGYGAYFLVMLVVGLYLTFPWDAAKDRVLDLVSRNTGVVISAAELQPSWLTGIEARDVKVTLPGSKDPIAIERLKARAKVFAFVTGKRGFTAALPIAHGDVAADVTIGPEVAQVKAETQNVELGLVPGLADAIGVPLTGSTTLKTDLTLGLKNAKQTSGSIEIKMNGLKLEKGAKIRLGMMGDVTMPDELSLGDFDWQIPVEDGKATLKSLKINGESVEAVIDGTIALFSPIASSNANLTLSFKPTEKLLKAQPILRGILPQDARGGDGFYTYAMNGPLRAPHMSPKRR